MVIRGCVPDKLLDFKVAFFFLSGDFLIPVWGFPGSTRGVRDPDCGPIHIHIKVLSPSLAKYFCPDNHKPLMIQPWSSHDPAMILSWSSHGPVNFPAMILMWSSHDPLMIQQWSSNGPVNFPAMVFTWSSHDPLVTQPWSSSFSSHDLHVI